MSTSLSKKSSKHTPYIPASKNLPEVTVKAVILGILLAMLLAGSNAYLGLKIGQTVSACIPAAVISMAILRFFKNSNILENNMVQTIASAGEVIAGGLIYTLPALVMMGFWQGFPYLQTTAIAVIGGTLGVLFSVPLRRAFILDLKLPFPEGVATAEVLKAGEGHETGAKDLLVGGLMAAAIKFCQSAFQIVGESAAKWFSVGGTMFGFGTGLSPVILAAGYIVGIRIGVCLFIGAVAMWLIILPIYGVVNGLPDAPTLEDIGMTIWSTKLRFVGVGAMVVGGLWAVISLVKPIKDAIMSSFDALSHAGEGEGPKVLRTEHDIPMVYIVTGTVALAIPVFILFSYVVDANDMPVTTGLFWATVAFATVFALIVGFICSSISGYMAGLVGATSNPLSGTVIAAILAVSLLLLVLLGTQVDFVVHTDDALSAAATAIIIGAMIACAGAISMDNLQDLMTGHVVGATPWKQELMLVIGVIAGAVVLTPILQVLYEAYGIGASFPREGMDPTQALAAPQATLMASVAKGVFLGNLPWTYIIIGIALGGLNILVNTILKARKSSWHFPVLAVALGLYLPFVVTMTIFVGGVLRQIVDNVIKKKRKKKALTELEAESAERRGVLFASGSIAGEALVGILLAIPFALKQSTSVFKLDFGFGPSEMMWSGIIIVGGFCYYFYRVGTTPLRD